MTEERIEVFLFHKIIASKTMKEKISFSWNDFGGITLKQLWNDQDFTDVNIVTADAHSSIGWCTLRMLVKVLRFSDADALHLSRIL